MRALILDDSARLLRALRHALAAGLPTIEVSEHDVSQRGWPGGRFEWATYDVVVAELALEPRPGNLTWIRDLHDLVDGPSVVVLAPRHDPELGAAALAAGAHAVLPKNGLTAQALCAAVSAAAAARQRALDDGGAVDDAEILRRQLVRPDGSAPTSSYRFVRLIGQGAMSRVYLAERMDDRLTVVLKLLDGTLARNEEAIRRFVLEAQILAGIESPHVVRIHDHGFTNRYGFIAMEFFSRGDLKQQIELGMSAEDAAVCLVNIARGLAAVHAAGIVHRDLKPANVMFRSDGSLAIADFGVSKRLDVSSDLTATGGIIGTPHYMCPEQGRGVEADARSDLYGAGVIFHEMLTGRRPFTGRSISAVIYQHLTAPVPELPPALAIYQPVLDRLLAKEPDDRYQTAEAVIEAVLPLLSPPVRSQVAAG
ncbi:MAG: serine/threonine protein kinase [Ectothiorhodospiraceae bacterium]|nr:serine/threonine protein kinase [Chromatiales bacterium]MCP5154438.1 serine/threonine protein kinase [Ectothiorhodospiraceae bacterium]